jgi:hypothetical protein
MGVRKNLRHSEEVRGRIRTSALITRLMSHSLGRLKVEMSDSQVRAALGLLKKALPDLQALEHLGEVTHKHHVVSAEPLNEADWQRTYGADQQPAPEATH